MTSGTDKLLSEHDVVTAVCGKLKDLGYTIEYICPTTGHGFDIIAYRHSRDGLVFKLYIEAKGETSSQNTSRRYGKRFNIGQARSHIAQAIYKSAEAVSCQECESEISVGIALPDNREHRSIISKVSPALHRWNIALFWVDHNGGIIIDSSWDV